MEVIRAENVSKCYSRKKNAVYAVDDVSLSIHKGDALGLVGESGCGKSTLGKLLLNLEHPSGGKVFFRGERIDALSNAEMRPKRKHMQMIFQDSSQSFNPYFTVRQILLEPLRMTGYTMARKQKLMGDILHKLELDESYLTRFPASLSGGQKQRIGIARALILNPEFVVCDEAVSSLDYILKNQSLELLLKLKRDMNLSYLFISHDLEAVYTVCNRIIVMYMGKIVERLDNTAAQTQHPYTKALLAASLKADPKDRSGCHVLFKEDEEQLVPKEGCIFQNRCLYATAYCMRHEAQLKEVEKGHYVACHYCGTQKTILK